MRVFPPDDRREQHRSDGDLGDRVVAPAQVPDVGGQRHGQDRSDDRAVRVDEGRGGSHRSPDVGPQQGWTRRQIKEGRHEPMDYPQLNGETCWHRPSLNSTGGPSTCDPRASTLRLGSAAGPLRPRWELR